MERFFRSPKAERLYLTHYTSNQNAKSDLLDCIYLYNHLRRHSILGNLRPMEFERRNASNSLN
ncbi:IS3 family transposase [Pseudomonas citronellolis]|uniref:IS3 family transposase n=1 Tax=Pseudomonas TaxID=286 RepID=UPI000A47BC11